MEQSIESQPNSESFDIDTGKLASLIESNDETMKLNAAHMALDDIENGKARTAVKRLLQESDKLSAINKDLYDYILSIRKDL